MNPQSKRIERYKENTSLNCLKIHLLFLFESFTSKWRQGWRHRIHISQYICFFFSNIFRAKETCNGLENSQLISTKKLYFFFKGLVQDWEFNSYSHCIVFNIFGLENLHGEKIEKIITIPNLIEFPGRVFLCSNNLQVLANFGVTFISLQKSEYLWTLGVLHKHP